MRQPTDVNVIGQRGGPAVVLQWIQSCLGGILSSLRVLKVIKISPTDHSDGSIHRLDYEVEGSKWFRILEDPMDVRSMLATALKFSSLQ